MKGYNDYSKVYKNIHKDAIEISKEYAPKLWKEPLTHRKMYALKWLREMSAVYKITCPKFVFDPDENGRKRRLTGGGTYDNNKNTIFLYGKYSFATLAYEFRHAIQNQKKVKMYLEDKDEDARAWSLSLFRLACPKSYKNAAEKGFLIGYNEIRKNYLQD